jgi:N-acetylmuramoyl-L-alanine amidase
MGVIIGIDDGHGFLNQAGTAENPGKRTPTFDDGHYILENVFNKGAAAYFEKACRRHGLTALQLAPEDVNVSLDERVRRANAWDCSIVVSWHFNAYRGNWDEVRGGISVHYQKGVNDSAKLAECVLKYLLKGTPQNNRGIVADDLQICRETKGTAILIESGFMDVMKEAKLMDQEWYWKEQAEQAMQGVCEYLGITYKTEGVNVVKTIVTYYGDGDIFAAILVSQKNNCPLMLKADYDASGIKAEKEILIGGKPGTDRFDSFKDAANLI